MILDSTQFMEGKKATETIIPGDKFNRYTEYRINAKGSVGTGALGKALQRKGYLC